MEAAGRRRIHLVRVGGGGPCGGGGGERNSHGVLTGDASHVHDPGGGGVGEWVGAGGHSGAEFGGRPGVVAVAVAGWAAWAAAEVKPQGLIFGEGETTGDRVPPTTSLAAAHPETVGLPHGIAVGGCGGGDDGGGPQPEQFCILDDDEVSDGWDEWFDVAGREEGRGLGDWEEGGPGVPIDKGPPEAVQPVNWAQSVAALAVAWAAAWVAAWVATWAAPAVWTS